MAVNVKMGVDLSSFNSGIREGQGILKGLNAEMKATEAEFKATGNAEKALADKTKTLNSQLQVQKGIADQAAQALKAMEEAGIKPTDQAYQKLYATMMNAQAGMNEAQAALNSLSSGEKQAAQEANNLASGVQGISKKMSLQQVIDGVDRITSGLEKAAKKAIDLGTELWNAVMDSAQRADDTETMAKMYGIDLDTFMKMQKLVAGGMDTSVETMLSAQDKLKRGIGKDNKEVMGYLEELGLTFKTVKGDVAALVTDDTEEMFWRVGKAIMEMGDAYDQEAAASALFGKSWKELKPLFETYEDFEAYKKARDAQVVNDEQTIRNLAELNDAVGNLESSWKTLKDELLGAIAPGLKIAADSLSTLLNSVTEYLKSDEGQEMLQKLGNAISGLFGDLSKIDPKQVVSGFVEVFTKVTGGIQWLVENADAAKGILATIVGAWGTITIGGNLLRLIQFVEGLTGMGLLGGGAAAAGGAGGGAATGLGLGAALKAGLSSVVKMMPYAAPLVLLADGLIHDQQIVSEMMEAGNVQLQDYESKSARYAGAEQFGLWDTLTKYISVAGGAGAEDAKGVEDFAKHYMEWFNDDVTDTMLDTMVDNMVKNDEAAFDQFHEVMERIANGELFETQEDQDALKAAMENVISELESEMENDPAMIPTDFSVPDDAAAKISEQVGPVEVPVELVAGAATGVMAAMMAAIGAGHANGLPFVPYDNYLARLHKGERVLTANQNRHYTYNSNNYFGNVNLNNGQDIEALCNSIDRHNRRQRSGYGS